MWNTNYDFSSVCVQRTNVTCAFRHAALHAPFDRVVAVMGMDLTLGYFYKQIVEQIPMCEHPNIR